ASRFIHGIRVQLQNNILQHSRRGDELPGIWAAAHRSQPVQSTRVAGARALIYICWIGALRALVAGELVQVNYG
ncbi:MAG: hypothetical protein ACREAC_08130, partial [Blastocatellia bacterium]